MADRTYRMIYIQNGHLDLVSEILMTRAEAYGQLAASRALHAICGWATVQCVCGEGFVATKGEVRRSEHVEHIDAHAYEAEAEDVESIALAVGLLAPASTDRLVVV